MITLNVLVSKLTNSIFLYVIMFVTLVHTFGVAYLNFILSTGVFFVTINFC